MRIAIRAISVLILLAAIFGSCAYLESAARATRSDFIMAFVPCGFVLLCLLPIVILVFRWTTDATKRGVEVYYIEHN